MFADYRIPQVLQHFGAIRYSNILLSRLQSGESFIHFINQIVRRHISEAFQIISSRRFG